MNTVPPTNPNLPNSNINNLQNNTPATGVNANQQASSSPEQAAYFASLVSGKSSSGTGGSPNDQSGPSGQQSGSTGTSGSTTNTSASSGTNVSNSAMNLSNTSISGLPNVNPAQGQSTIASSIKQQPISISVPQVSDAVAAALMSIQNMQPATVQQAAGTASAANASAIISQIATQVANQILVSAPTSNQGPQMVTVILNQNILPSTQINIQRDNLGTLNVMFNTQNANSAQVLNGLQNTIQTSLSANLGQVNVGVSMTNPGASNIGGSPSSGSSTSGSGAQSSGFQGDAGQGRSRGQYIPQEELPS